MAQTTVNTATDTNVAQQWDADFHELYVRNMRFCPWMGSSENSIFQVKEQLMKSPGDQITVSLISKLSGDGVTGTETLEGSEEVLANFGYKVTVDMLRNAVRIHKMEEQKSALDFRNAAKTMLTNWRAEKLRDHMLRALGSPVKSSGMVAYADATEAQKDAWLVANTDRIVFGASSPALTDHSADVANIDDAADKLTRTIVGIAKRTAQAADPLIRPISMDNGDELFVMFCHSLAFRDLKADLETLHSNADVRGKKNKIFVPGSLLWDNVLCVEIPEIAALGLVGASSEQVVPNYLCGAQALTTAWAQRAQTEVEQFDYKVSVGVSVSEIRGVSKNYYNEKQHGVVTVYTAGKTD